MKRWCELILGLAAVLAVGLVNSRASGEKTEDPFVEGVRLLEEDDRARLPTADDMKSDALRHIAAKEALARAVVAKPDDSNARAWYALALLKIYEKDAARREAAEAVRLGPKAALGYRVRGLVHADGGDHAKALDDLNAAVKLGPRDAANLRTRGQFFAAQHQSAHALADYASALKIDPADIKTYWLRAMLHMEAMNVDLAQSDFDAAIRIQPDLPALRQARGLLRLFKKDYAGVTDDLGIALKARPDGEMFCMRGYALSELGRHEEAIRDFDEAIRFDANAKLLLLRGLCYQKLGRLDRALLDLDEAVKMKPEAESFVARALLLKEKGRNDKAADDLSDAVRREPANATFRIARGDVFLKLGREDAAMADYDEAVRLGPDKAESHLARGVGRLLVGRDGAGDDFRAVLRLKGWHHEIATTCILDGYIADLLDRRLDDARAFLDQALARYDRATWPYPLVQCLHGDLTEAIALAAAPSAFDRVTARVCLGVKHITDGRREDGLRELREVCDDAGPTSIAKDIARAALHRAEGSSPAHRR
jgi:tetratricopeptide (TPR) repeat protein